MKNFTAYTAEIAPAMRLVIFTAHDSVGKSTARVETRCQKISDILRLYWPTLKVNPWTDITQKQRDGTLHCHPSKK